MAQPKATETYYDLLKVPRHASISEIVSAYNTAKSAFSRDSVATYSLFSDEETEEILTKLEQAYLTLSNIEKKREYDRKLESNIAHPEETTEMTDINHSPLHAIDTTPHPTVPMNTPIPSDDTQEEITQVESAPAPSQERVITGRYLRELRDQRGLSVEDVSRVTKIPSKFLRAVEEGNEAALPARVYLQGFVKNLATLYKLDPVATARAYLRELDRQKGE